MGRILQERLARPDRLLILLQFCFEGLCLGIRSGEGPFIPPLIPAQGVQGPVTGLQNLQRRDLRRQGRALRLPGLPDFMVLQSFLQSGLSGFQSLLPLVELDL